MKFERPLNSSERGMNIELNNGFPMALKLFILRKPCFIKAFV